MILDGKKIAQEIRKKLCNEISTLNCEIGLAFILVGTHAPSKSYVSMKQKACQEVGINSKIYSIENAEKSEVLDLISSLNKDKKTHGILLQQPLPHPLIQDDFLEAIDPKKDVDGLHPVNQGKVVLSDKTGFTPCTPMGILKILQEYHIKTEGKHVVILGRSNIVAKPLANLLLQKGPFGNATVTVAHSSTKNLKAITTQGDILIAAVGKQNFVAEDMVKDNAIVIDVGINRTQEHKIVGDVAFTSVEKKASYITPVPGGVGPMTIVSLLENTLKCYKLSML